jgi:hypothetical protein
MFLRIAKWKKSKNYFAESTGAVKENTSLEAISKPPIASKGKAHENE